MTEILAGTLDGLLHVPGGDRDLGGTITALAGGDGDLWAITDDRTVWRRRDGTWRRVADVLEVVARCLLPDQDGALVGTSRARLLRVGGERPQPVDGFERVEGRGDWYTPWGGPPDVRSISRGPDGTVYANVHVGGIVRATSATHWEPTIDIHADVHQVLAHPDRSGTVLAAAAIGLVVSRDGGETWDTIDRGLHATYCRAVALAGDTVLVTASTGPYTERAAVYRMALDGEGVLERCTDGLPEWFPGNIDTHALAASGSTAAFGTSGGEIYVSQDAGRVWTQVASDLPPVACLLLE